MPRNAASERWGRRYRLGKHYWLWDVQPWTYFNGRIAAGSRILRLCPVCTEWFVSPRGTYCSRRCKGIAGRGKDWVLPLRACIVCGERSPWSRCLKHQPPKWRKSNTPAGKRGYGWEWQKVRKQVLAEEPTCRSCRMAPATTVDHIVNKARGGTDARENLQGLCVACHRVKTATEGKHAAAAARRASRAR